MPRRRLLSLLALVLAGTGCHRPGRLDRAKELTYQRDFAGAVAAYHDALIDLGRDESPEARDARAAALRAVGDLYNLQLHDPVKAAQAYRDLAERYPERPETFDARVQLADILRDRFHDTRAALAQLAALTQSFPNHLDADRYQYRAAMDYFALRDYAQTETELKLLLARYPGTGYRVDAQMLLASCLSLEGRKAQAVELYGEIAREHPGADAGRANLEIARIYEEANDWEKAENALARALPDHPEPAVVTLALSRVRRRVALKRPADLHDHAAIFDHKANGQVAERGE